MFGALIRMYRRSKTESYRVYFCRYSRMAIIKRRSWLTGKYHTEHTILRPTVRDAVMEAAVIVDAYNSCSLPTKEYQVTFHDYNEL